MADIKMAGANLLARAGNVRSSTISNEKPIGKALTK